MRPRGLTHPDLNTTHTPSPPTHPPQSIRRVHRQRRHPHRVRRRQVKPPARGLQVQVGPRFGGLGGGSGGSSAWGKRSAPCTWHQPRRRLSALVQSLPPPPPPRPHPPPPNPRPYVFEGIDTIEIKNATLMPQRVVDDIIRSCLPGHAYRVEIGLMDKVRERIEKWCAGLGGLGGGAGAGGGGPWGSCGVRLEVNRAGWQAVSPCRSRWPW
jgi:hypothetical protein